MNLLKSAALPWKLPPIVVGRRINAFCRSIATVASLRDFPGARLKLMVAVTNPPWWETASGVVPSRDWVKADSGIIVDFEVLTAWAVDVAPLPVAAIELAAALRAASAARAEAMVGAAAVTTVPAATFEAWVPERLPPEVLT